jgi:Domain of unknown function (DUF4115)
VAGRHRRTSHAKPRHYQRRHAEPPTRAAVLAPIGLAVAVVAGGAIAFTQASGGGTHGPAVGAGVVLTLPSPSSPPPVQAFLTSHSKQKPGSSHRRHRAAKPRHHLAPDALLIRDTGPPCYVEVTRRDGRVLVERVIHGHQRLAYRQHQLAVVLGNAGAVRISIDGRHLHRAGRPGQVVHFHVR